MKSKLYNIEILICNPKVISTENKMVFLNIWGVARSKSLSRETKKRGAKCEIKRKINVLFSK